MALYYASYYGLARVNDSGPEVKNWAATDTNPQTISLLLKSFEGHHHNASTPINYPGYNVNNPATPSTPLLTLSATGGFIAAGTTVGVRLSFLNQLGLETQGSLETTIQTPSVAVRPTAPTIGAPVSTPVPGAVSGGTFIYAMTKRLGSGETQPSDITTISVPFSTTATSSYTVPLSFPAVASYSDGTDSTRLYRSTGFDSAFVLLKTFSATPDGYTTTYTDSNVIQDGTQQPPQTSEFGKTSLLTINWANITIPPEAYRFRLYLTQQTGVWGTQNLFQDYDLKNPATPVPTQTNYLGTEILGTGYPIEFSQIPAAPSQIYLTSEAYGGYRLTEPADAKGYQTWNFVLPDQNHATPIPGSAYLDSTSGQVKVMTSSAGYVTLGVGSAYDSAVAADSPVSYWPLREYPASKVGSTFIQDVMNYSTGGFTFDGLPSPTLGTSNWVRNPSFEAVDISQWTTYGTNTIARSTVQAKSGVASLLMTYQNDTRLASHTSLKSLQPGDIRTISAYIYVPNTWNGGTISLVNQFSTGATVIAQQVSNPALTNQWQRIWLVYQSTAVASYGGSVFVLAGSAPSAGQTIYLDAVYDYDGDQRGTAYGDGDNTTYWAWIGPTSQSNSASILINTSLEASSTSSLGVPGPVGDAETAISLSGNTNQYIYSSARVTAHQLATPYSLEAWVNPADRNALYTVLAHSVDYVLALNSTSGIPTFNWSNNAASLQATTPVAVNAWSHIAAVNDGTNAYIYINGVLNTSTALLAGKGMPSISTNPLSVGGQYNGSSVSSAPFKGSVAKAAIYNKALPGSRVLAHYTAGSQNAYIHGNLEQGGHLSSHIYAAPTGPGGPTLDQIAAIVATPVGLVPQLYRKQASNIYKVAATPTTLQNSTVGGFRLMSDMDTVSQWPTGINPSFPGQWFESEFQTLTTLLGSSTSGQIASCQLYINGNPIPETYCSFGGPHASTPSIYGQLNFTYATPLTRSNNRFQVFWQASFSGYIQSIAPTIGQTPARYFMIKEIF